MPGRAHVPIVEGPPDMQQKEPMEDRERRMQLALELAIVLVSATMLGMTVWIMVRI